MSRPILGVNRLRDIRDDIRLALLGAWRGRERGLAVFAGVFLASLVITTVLSYGVGLSQIFFQESLESEPFDAKIEFRKAPSQGAQGWTNNTSTLIEVCDELVERAEITDCSLILGRQGIHGGGFFNEDFIAAQPLEMRSVSAANTAWQNLSFEYPELADSGPPITTKRSIRLLGPSAFDGEIAERLGEQIIFGMGNWSTPEDVAAQRGVYIPSTIASEAKAEVGDTLDTLTFAYVVERKLTAEGGIPDDECEGSVDISEIHYAYCRIEMTLTNLTIMGVYEPWTLGNPTLAPNPIFTTWTILDEEDRKELIDNDHMYLGITIDRTLLPTESTDAAAEWVQDIGMSVQAQNYTSEGIELFYFDIIGGTITFLRIFLGLIQTFDYIIMIPIVVLSLAVLIYGLVLSLEQRRREISIHRVIGATSKRLQRMVLLELSVMAALAWFAGYILAMAAVPIVLSSVGFMEFSSGAVNVNPALGVKSTLLTAIATLGLAIIFARGRTKQFIELEIDEGVRMVREQVRPKLWLHWLLFIIGMVAVIDTWMEMNGSEDGLNDNFFIEGLLGIFGPFMLWIGGALLLGRIGAAGPRIMQVFFGRTRLLSDVKRGLKGSGSTESVNRLAVIMLLTLSIVTLAAVQGYTGTIVDERTASATVGAELQLIMEQPASAGYIEGVIEDVYGGALDLESTTVPTLTLATEGGDLIQVWVLLNDSRRTIDWFEQSIPGDDVTAALDRYDEMTFSAGEDAAFLLGLWGSGRKGGDRGDILLDAEDERSEEMAFIWEEIGFSFSEADQGEAAGIDPMAILEGYSELMLADWSGLDLSGQNLSGRNLSRTDLSDSNLSGADLSGADLSEALLFGTNLAGANLAGANLQNAVIFEFGPSLLQADLSQANLLGAFGDFDLGRAADISGAICPDGTAADETACGSGPSQIPPPLSTSLFEGGTGIELDIHLHNATLRYIGVHEFIPGVPMATMPDSLIIGEEAWRAFVGDDVVGNFTADTWIISIEGLEGDELEAFRANLEADSRVESAMDWSTEHGEVERNGGLIFGTPGLLSLQFVVASIAAVASAFVFLSLVLNQRQKELAVLQAIGASPNQILRLVLFEILSIVSVSMLLGVLLGMGLALSFNGLFEIFGFIFQIFGGSSTVITRDLIWPWTELAVVSAIVFTAVVLALLLTTRKALRADLATVLKGE